MANFRTIKLKKYADIIEQRPAASAITPGQVLELTNANKVQKNSRTDAHIPVWVALEDELQGKTTRENYAADDPVQIWCAQPGEEFAAIIDSAFDPAVGALLQAGADGELVAAGSGVAQFVVLASKEVDDESIHRVRVKVI